MAYADDITITVGEEVIVQSLSHAYNRGVTVFVSGQRDSDDLALPRETNANPFTLHDTI